MDTMTRAVLLLSVVNVALQAALYGRASVTDRAAPAISAALWMLVVVILVMQA